MVEMHPTHAPQRRGGLYVKRKAGQSVTILVGDLTLKLHVIRVRDGEAEFRCVSPPEFRIWRSELLPHVGGG